MKHPILSRLVFGFALLAALLSVGLKTTDAEAQTWSGRGQPVYAQRGNFRREVRRQEMRREVRQDMRQNRGQFNRGPVVVAPRGGRGGRNEGPRGRHGRW